MTLASHVQYLSSHCTTHCTLIFLFILNSDIRNFNERKMHKPQQCTLQHLPDHVVQNSSMFEVHQLHLCVETRLHFKALFAFNLEVGTELRGDLI